MLEVLLAVGFLPLFYRLGAKPQHFTNTIERRKVVEDPHDWNVSDLVDFFVVDFCLSLNIEADHEIT